MIKSEIVETKETRQDRGGNRTKSFAETMECGFRPFLGWLKHDKHGDLLYKVYYEEDGDFSFFFVDQCCCAKEHSSQFKTARSVRQ